MNLNTRTKEILKILLISLIILTIIVGIIFLVKIFNKKNNIKKITETYTANIDIINNKKIEELEDLKLKINGNTVIGVLKIDKINFEGLVYEGTNSKILKKGIGHFDNTPSFDGNACFAGHNYWNIWSKLHTLKLGDKISYISYLGTREYEVFCTKEIDETDWSLLQNTDENIITLITCIKNKPEKRLCVQAKEKNF